MKIIFLDVVIQTQMKHSQARYVPKKNLPPEMGSQAAGMQWKKSFLPFTKPFSNDIVSSWCLHLIDLLMFFRLFQHITKIIGLATTHLRKIFYFSSNQIALPSTMAILLFCSWPWSIQMLENGLLVFLIAKIILLKPSRITFTFISLFYESFIISSVKTWSHLA